MKCLIKILQGLLLFFFINASRAQNSFCQYLGNAFSERAYDMTITSDGGYVLAGNYDSTSSIYSRCYLVKTNSGGDISWKKTFGGLGNNRLKSVTQTLDKGIVTAGFYSAQQAGDQEGYVVKFDSLGNLLWSDTIGGLYADEFASVCATSDGGCAVAGSTSSFGSIKVYVVKLDVSGSIQWSRTFGGAGAFQAYSIQQTSDGGYIVGGTVPSWDGLLLKLDASGNLQWSQVIGSGSSMTMYSVIQTSDGGYAAVSEAWLFGNMDVVVVKTDNLGNQQWVKVFDRWDTQTGYDLIQNAKGELIVAATANNSGNYGMIMKLDNNGTLLSENWLSTPNGYVDLRAIALTALGEIVVAGNYANTSGVQDVYLALLDTSGTNCCTFPYIGNDSLMPTLGGMPSGTLAVVSSNTGNAAAIGGAVVNKNILCNQCGGLSVSLSSGDTTICYGTSLTLTANVSGGTAPFTYQWVPGGQNTSSISITPQESASYSVTVTDSSGTCSITKFVEVRVGPADSVTSNPTICPGYSAVLGSYTAATFTWSTGSTAQTITVTPLATTIYTMNASDFNGCAHSYIFTVTVGPCPPTGQFCASYLGMPAAGGVAYSLCQTPDGGFLIGGQYFFNRTNMGILKIDAQGNIIWSKLVGDTCQSCNENATTALVMHDGNYIISGSYNYTGQQTEAYLICFDPAGNVLWRKAYDYFDGLAPNTCIQAKDKGFIMAGSYTFNSNPYRWLIIKTDSVGALQWTRSYIDTAGKDIGPTRIVQTPDGGYVVAGGRNMGLGQSDILLVKLDATGNVLWQKSVGGGNDANICYDMIQTKDKGFAISGATFSYGFPGGDAYLVKCDSTGALLWTRTYGYNYNVISDYAMAITETANGSLVVAGSVAQNSLGEQAMITKFDVNGNFLWSKISNTFKTVYMRIVNTSDGGFAMAGQWLKSSGDSEYYFTKTDSLGNACCMLGAAGVSATGGNITGPPAITSTANVVAVVLPLMIQPGLIISTNCNPIGIENTNVIGREARIYPNPSKDEITIELENKSDNNLVRIFDMLGNECLREVFSGQKKIISVSGLKSGAYFFSILSDGVQSVHKVIVMKD